MRCICTNSAWSEAEHGQKVKLEVLTTPRFSVATPSSEPNFCNHNNRHSEVSFKCANIQRALLDWSQYFGWNNVA